MSFPSPSVNAPALANWQYYYQGLTFGEGTSYPVTNVDGLDLAPIRSGDAGRPLDQGELIGIDLQGGRDITFDFWIGADGSNSLQTLLSNLAAVTVPSPQGTTEYPLFVQLPNLPLLVTLCRPRKRSVTIDKDYGAAAVATPAVMLHSSDPRFYVAPTQTVSMNLPTPGSGLGFPVTFPAAFGGGTGASVVIDNTGNMEMRPVLVITGPVTNPWVQNTSITGSPKLTFSNPFQSSFTLNAGDTLTIDLDWKSISYLVSGTTVAAQQQSWLQPGSTWWNLQPGSNTIQWGSSDSGSAGGTLQIQYAPAYVSVT